jgi:hypothetical protein
MIVVAREFLSLRAPGKGGEVKQEDDDSPAGGAGSPDRVSPVANRTHLASITESLLGMMVCTGTTACASYDRA